MLFSSGGRGWLSISNDKSDIQIQQQLGNLRDTRWRHSWLYLTWYLQLYFQSLFNLHIYSSNRPWDNVTLLQFTLAMSLLHIIAYLTWFCLAKRYFSGMYCAFTLESSLFSNATVIVTRIVIGWCTLLGACSATSWDDVPLAIDLSF